MRSGEVRETIARFWSTPFQNATKQERQGDEPCNPTVESNDLSDLIRLFRLLPCDVCSSMHLTISERIMMYHVQSSWSLGIYDEHPLSEQL